MGIQKTGVLKLHLTRFRSYRTLDLEFNPSLEPVVLVGKNGIGKTNVLEALSLLAPGRGLRNAKLTEFAFQQGGEILDKNWGIASTLIRDNMPIYLGTGVGLESERRQVKLDGKILSKQAELGNVLRVLWLTPAQDRLFSGEPIARRRFLDRLVQAFDPEHTNRLTEYAQVLKQWMTLLREKKFDLYWLDALEQQIVSYGISIITSRQDVVEKISERIAMQVFSDFPIPQLILTGLLEKELESHSAVVVEDFFREYLKKNRQVIACGGNIYGAHTSDFKVVYRQKNIDATLSSSGEQKALLLSIVLAQVYALVEEQGIGPLLLLDEVMAHLDDTRRSELLEKIHCLPAHVFMTGAEKQDFNPLARNSEIINVEQFYEKKVA